MFVFDSTAKVNRHTITPLHAAHASPIRPLDGSSFAIAQPAMLVDAAHAIYNVLVFACDHPAMTRR